MLVPNQYIEVTWVPFVVKYYVEKGYTFTKINDKFLVKAEDLPDNSHKKIKAICDFCGRDFTTEKAAYTQNKKTGKISCKKCQPKKVKELWQKKYGVDNVFMLDSVKEKSKQTCLEKYGVENLANSKEIQEKIKNTNLKKFGTEYSIASEQVRDKIKQTNLNKYGFEIVSKSKQVTEKTKETNLKKYGYVCTLNAPEIAEKAMQTNIEKYGVPYATQSKEIIAKMRKSLYKNGKVPISKPEQKMCEILKEIYGEENCVPSYPYDSLNFDCLVKIGDIKIDVEYDGWYFHKNKKEYDKRRNYFLIRRGFKVLRIKANKELPTKEQIVETIDYLVNGHSLYEIILDIEDEEIV